MAGIYIPIWLDLLSRCYKFHVLVCIDLHSNMVRFIINERDGVGDMYGQFTFQYG